MISPAIKTTDVPMIIIGQSIMPIGSTLKNAGTRFMIAICPRKIIAAIPRNPLHPFSRKAECPVEKARALKRFQNWKRTKVQKTRPLWPLPPPSPVGREPIRPRMLLISKLKYRIAKRMANMKVPVNKIDANIFRVMINERRLRGLSYITLFEGGNEASAIAAKVSIMRLTHNIWVTVSGDSVPIKAPASTIRHATTLTVSWKRMNR